MNIKLWTDGACSNNQKAEGKPVIGGYAFITIIDNEIDQEYSRSEEDTTNQRMELMGVVAGLSYITLHHGKVDKLQIYSDAKYVTDCFNQEWHLKWRNNGWRTSSRKPVANQDIWEDILTMYDYLKDSGTNVKFTHIPGHQGIGYNDQVDKLAKEAVATHPWRKGLSL